MTETTIETQAAPPAPVFNPATAPEVVAAITAHQAAQLVELAAKAAYKNAKAAAKKTETAYLEALTAALGLAK